MNRQSSLARFFRLVFQAGNQIRQVKHELKYSSCILLCASLFPGFAVTAMADPATEYRIKTAFLYNFAHYTEWPGSFNDNFNLCFYGNHPFGAYLDHLREKQVQGHAVLIRETSDIGALHDCQLVFVGRNRMVDLKEIIESVAGKPILIVSDNPGTIQPGIMLNMDLTKEGKIGFEADLGVARKNGLNFSSQLLRIAKNMRNE